MTRTEGPHSAVRSARAAIAALVALSAFTVTLCSAVPARAEGTMTVTGRLLDIETGLPIEGMFSYRTMSGYGGLGVGPDGTFSLPVRASDTRFRIDGGSEYVTQWYPGEYFPEAASPDPYSGSATVLSGRDVYLSRLGTGTVCGRVVDADGDPVFLGQVQAYRKVGASNVWAPVPLPGGVTGPRGEYAITGLRPGTYRLGASASMTASCTGWFGGLTSSSATSFVMTDDTPVTGMTILLDNDVAPRWPAEATAEVPLYSGATSLFGNVFDAVTGVPVPGVPVRSSTLSGPGGTDSLGAFEVPVRPEWNSTVFCAADTGTYFDGYFDAQDSALGPDEAAPNYYPAANSFGAQFLLNRKGTCGLSGTALRADGTPAANVRLLVLQYATAFDVWDPIEREVVTDADGSFGLVGVSAGRYRVAVRAAQGPTTGPMLLSSADGAAAEVELRAGQTGTMSGRFYETDPPTTDVSAVPALNAYDARMSLVASETPYESGVAAIIVSVNGQPQVLPGRRASLDWSAEGRYEVGYSAVDVLGNVEPTRTVSFLIDCTPPTSVPISVQTTYTGDATFAFSGADDLSGYDTTWASLDGGDFHAGDRLVVPTPGPHTLMYFARDKAGVSGEMHVATFFVQQTSRVVVEPGVRIAGAPGGYLTLKGHVEYGSGTDRVVAEKVSFARSTSTSGPWTPIDWPINASQSFSVSVPVSERTFLRISYPGADGCAPSSTTVTLTSKASVYAPKTASTQRYRSTYTIGGTFRPRHKSSAPVTLEYQRYQRNSAGKLVWVTRKTVKVYAKPSGSSMAYSTRVRLPYRGSWRVRAVHIDTNHAATAGAYASVKVK